MIIGLGTDIVSVDRLKKGLEHFEEKFAGRIFTAAEMSRGSQLSGDGRAAFFAGRWAAKEAVAKALGCGFGEKCRWLDIEVTNRKNGSPEMILTGKTEKTFAASGGKTIHLSISHERDYACATVIIEG